MISIFKKNKSIGNKRGMTYVELIVVLSIFFIMSGVVLGNYGSFQKKIEIKNLANDIAQTILKAQKDSIAGLNGDSFIAPSKPSYGIYFDTSDDAAKAQFIYFADKNNAGYLLLLRMV